MPPVRDVVSSLRPGVLPSSLVNCTTFRTLRDDRMDGELMRVWQLVHELSEQLAHNQKLTATLQSQARALQVRWPVNVSSPLSVTLFSRPKLLTIAPVSF